MNMDYINSGEIYSSESVESNSKIPSLSYEKKIRESFA